MKHDRLSSATLFAVSCAVIILEVALTRIFSFIAWYHLTYLVVSLALLGFGAAGSRLAIRTDLADADYPHTIARYCLLFSVLTVLLAAALPAIIAPAGFRRSRRRLHFGAGIALTLLVIGSVISIHHAVVPLEVVPDKAFPQAEVAYTKWNILNRIDVLRPLRGEFEAGGRLSKSYRGASPELMLIYQDATAPTGMLHTGRAPRECPLFGYYLQGASYVIRPHPRKSW